jgi:hypothetical protein
LHLVGDLSFERCALSLEPDLLADDAVHEVVFGLHALEALEALASVLRREEVEEGALATRHQDVEGEVPAVVEFLGSLHELLVDDAAQIGRGLLALANCVRALPQELEGGAGAASEGFLGDDRRLPAASAPAR